MMQRSMRLCLLKHHLTKSISVFISSDAAADLPNPCIAMGADANYIVCHHPEKSHPYEKTRPIDRNDPTFAQNDTVFTANVQKDFNERYYKNQISKRDFRLETDKLAKMFNEHPTIFRLTPRKDRIHRASQFQKPKPDRSGI